MRRFRQAIKRCLRPLFRFVKRPLRPLLRRFRDFVVAPVVQKEEAQYRRFEALVSDQVHRLMSVMHDHYGYVPPEHQLTEWLHALPGRELEPAGAASAVPINAGPNRILASHPVVPLVYLDSEESEVTPRILMGRYDRGLTHLLKRLVNPGDCVLEIGPGNGYHTLTLAALVQASGKLLICEPEGQSDESLRRNLRMHRLEKRVTTLPRVKLATDCKPTLIRLDVGPAIMEYLEELLPVLQAAQPPMLLIAVREEGEMDLRMIEMLASIEMQFAWVEPNGMVKRCLADDVAAEKTAEREHLMVMRERFD